MRVLVTGATGLVGVEVCERLRSLPGAEVVGVSRPRSARDGRVVAWDMAASEAPDALGGEWDAIVHAAADTRWTLSPEQAERANVATVDALAPLVSARTHVVHVSTAYAVGLRGDVESPALDDYRNSYEWSKAAAERLVRERFASCTIVRPPLIVGRRSDGRAARFAGMYTVLRGITSSMVPAVVGDAGGYCDVIPVDDLAEVILDVLAGGAGEVLTVAAGRGAPKVETAVGLMTTTLNEWRAERGLDPFDEPPLISRESWNRFFLPFARSELTARQLRVVELLANFEPYLSLKEPLEPSHPVRGVEACIPTAVRYWAGVESRQASLAPKPWKAAARA